MKHEVDLNRYKVHTDLAIEDTNLLKENMKIEKIDDITITSIDIDQKISIKTQKKVGKYVTLEFNDITDYNNRTKLKEIFVKTLKKLIKDLNLLNKKCLVIGLGNSDSTPDSLGPLTVKKIIVTRHIAALGQLGEGFSNVCAYDVGVKGQTGIESFEIISAIVKTVNPEFIIVVDALASQAVERLNKTIQITDAGINPGSGIGNNCQEISRESLQIPVIAIGVPTVVDAVTIVNDTINYIYKHFIYVKNNLNNPANKLKVGNENYLKKNIKIDKSSRQEILGLIGNLDEEETKELIYETLSPTGYNLMVTPKEIDFVIGNLVDVISGGINQAVHDNVTNM